MTSKRTSIIWPLLILAIAALWAAQALNILPTSATELVTRACPVVLVVIGLMLFLGRRVQFGNLLAIGLSVALVGGMMAAAYGRQGQRFSTDQQKAIAQQLDPQITSVKVVINTLNTEIDITPGDKAEIAGQFVGSKDSIMSTDFKADGGTGTFTVSEAQNSAIPSLEGIGRGKLTLTLPVASQITQLSVNINGRGGDISLNAGGTTLNELTIAAGAGEINLAAMPNTLATLSVTASAGGATFEPLPASLTALMVTTATGDIALDTTATSLKNMTVTANAGGANIKLPTKSGLIGTIKASGDITVTVDPTIAASFKLAGNASNNPTYNQGDYILTIDKTLISRRSNEQQMQITIDTPSHATVQ